jgi:hypothetical protein
MAAIIRQSEMLSIATTRESAILVFMFIQV